MSAHDAKFVVVTPEALRELLRDAVRDVLREAQAPAVRLISADEAAALLGVNKRTVLKWTKEEGMPHRELGPKTIRFVDSEIIAWGASRGRRG